MAKQHHPELADDLAGQEIERAEGEPEEHDRIDHQPDQARGDHRQHKPAARERRIDGEIGEFRQQKRGRRGEHQRARRKAGGNRRAGDDRGNAEFYAQAGAAQGRASTRAMPIIKHAGRRHQAAARPAAGRGRWRCRPCRRGRSSNWPVGMVRQNRTRKTPPSMFFCFSMRSCSCSFVRLHECRKPLRPQLAGRALAAAIAPVVAVRAVAQIAAMGVLDNEVEQGLPADLLGHGEGRRPCRSTSAAYGW